MDIFHIHPDTGEYLLTGQADPSPLEPGQFLIPAYAMVTPPPPVSDHEAAVAVGGTWQVVPDYRGLTYYLADGSKREITALGVVPPLDALSSPPVTAAQLMSEVDRERSRRWRAGFPVEIGGSTKWFHSDEFSLTQHLGLKDKARDVLATGGAMTDNITISGQPVQWSTMDGSSVTITAQVAFDLVSSAGLQQALVFAASQAHKAAINSAEDLSGYDVLANWPAVFGE